MHLQIAPFRHIVVMIPKGRRDDGFADNFCGLETVLQDIDTCVKKKRLVGNSFTTALIHYRLNAPAVSLGVYASSNRLLH